MSGVKPALKLRLGQQLKLTPQLRQAIRLLQMSQLELESELTMALESNPMLESAEERRDAESAASPDEVGESAERETDAGAAEVEAVSEPSLDMDTGWEDEFTPRSGSGSGDHEPQEAAGSITDSLHDHLLWQLNLTPMSDRD